MGEKDLLISQYIDNQLDIDEKINFITEIHRDAEYFSDALSLLEVERELSFPKPPEIKPISVKKQLNLPLYTSFAALAASLIILAKVFMFSPAESPEAAQHRFVVYLPEAGDVQVAGSFSAWQPIKMQRVSGGYWQAVLPLRNGEYSYNYIIDGKEQLPDPSVPAKQDDGFGGENSIISIGEKI